MSQVIFTEGAAQGLERCRLFLTEKNPRAAIRAAQIILQYFALLESNPEIGRPLDDHPGLRELVIPFGETGYVGLYRHDLKIDTVYLLAFRHQKEAGY